MKRLYTLGSIAIFLAVVFIGGGGVHAQQDSGFIDANPLRPHTTVSISPRSGSFVEGSTFQVPILLDTQGHSVNSVDITINFDATKLAVVEPSGGQSIVGIWITPPFFDNTNGIISYTGVIPGGITTQAGLVGTIIFRVKGTGSAVVIVNPEFTRVLLNDGLASGTVVNLGRATYTLIPKAPEGPQVFSETHPIHTNWYNNNNLNLAWERGDKVVGFSYVLDDAPNTVPDNTIDVEDTAMHYEVLKDGLWHFHIKAIKDGVWGNTTHFPARIDTTPPSKPHMEIYRSLEGASLVENVFVSFFATDNLSGIDHYEVATLSQNQSHTQSPLFIESVSPFRIAHATTENLEIIVRAIDGAGNSSDASVITGPSASIFSSLDQNFILIVVSAIVMLIISFLIYYTARHHLIAYAKKVLTVARKLSNDRKKV